MNNRRNISVPDNVGDFPVQTPRSFEDWGLDIPPEEYARRVLYFYQRDIRRSLEECIELANVNHLCTVEQAAYIKDILTTYISSHES